MRILLVHIWLQGIFIRARILDTVKKSWKQRLISSPTAEFFPARQKKNAAYSFETAKES
jgi:hypothetical protein